MEQKNKKLASINNRTNRIPALPNLEEFNSSIYELKPNYGVSYYNNFNYWSEKSYYDNPQFKGRLLKLNIIKKSKLVDGNSSRNLSLKKDQDYQIKTANIFSNQFLISKQSLNSYSDQAESPYPLKFRIKKKYQIPVSTSNKGNYSTISKGSLEIFNQTSSKLSTEGSFKRLVNPILRKSKEKIIDTKKSNYLSKHLLRKICNTKLKIV